MSLLNCFPKSLIIITLSYFKKKDQSFYGIKKELFFKLILVQKFKSHYKIM